LRERATWRVHLIPFTRIDETHRSGPQRLARNELRDRVRIDEIQPLARKAAVEDAAMHRWFEARKDAGRWPPQAPQGTLALDDD
jgi:hypothetical protein